MWAILRARARAEMLTFAPFFSRFVPICAGGEHPAALRLARRVRALRRGGCRHGGCARAVVGVRGGLGVWAAPRARARGAALLAAALGAAVGPAAADAHVRPPRKLPRRMMMKMWLENESGGVMAAARCARARACNNGCFAERWASVPWACLRAPPPPSSSAALRCENIGCGKATWCWKKEDFACEVQQPRVPSSLRCAACRPFRRAARLLIAGLAPAAAHRAAARPPPAARGRTVRRAGLVVAGPGAPRRARAARRLWPRSTRCRRTPTRAWCAPRARPRGCFPGAVAPTFRRRCQP
jgi:hypothetical protein